MSESEIKKLPCGHLIQCAVTSPDFVGDLDRNGCTVSCKMCDLEAEVAALRLIGEGDRQAGERATAEIKKKDAKIAEFEQHMANCPEGFKRIELERELAVAQTNRQGAEVQASCVQERMGKAEYDRKLAQRDEEREIVALQVKAMDMRQHAEEWEEVAKQIEARRDHYRAKLMEREKTIARMRGWLGHIIWIVCPSDASLPAEMACANAAANALENKELPPDTVSVPRDGIDTRYPAHPEVAAALELARRERDEAQASLKERDSKCALSSCDWHGIGQPYGIGDEGSFSFCPEHARRFREAWVWWSEYHKAEAACGAMRAHISDRLTHDQLYECTCDECVPCRWIAKVPALLKTDIGAKAQAVIAAAVAWVKCDSEHNLRALRMAVREMKEKP